MSDRLITALRAASLRIAFQRRALPHAIVLLCVYQEGAVFSCVVPGAPEGACYEEVNWTELSELTPERAGAIVDRVCAAAHEFLCAGPA